MTKQEARVYLGPGKNATIVPGDGVTLRTLERTLTTAGIQTTVLRDPKRVIVRIEDLYEARQALSAWCIEADEETVAAERTLLEAEKRRRRARAALHSIEVSGSPERASTYPGCFKQLDSHQLIAVAAATHPDVLGLCLFDEQGLGKTVTALFAFHRLKMLGEIDKLLIFAPKNMVLEWVRDTERFFGSRYTAVAVTGTEREKRALLERRGDIFVTNFETAVRLQTKLKHLVRSNASKTLLVVDESFYVKNAEARRTRALKEIRGHVERCLVLCGTPAPNSPHDIVEQFNIADGGVTFSGAKIPDGKEDARPIITRIVAERGVYLRRLKADVLPKLPSKTFHRLLVPMEPQQLQIYAATLKGLISDLQSVDDLSFRRQITSFMAKRLALLQLCSNPSTVIDGYKEVPAKLLALDSILEELISRRGEKVVLWSFFRRSLEAIFDRYDQFNPVRVDGSVSDAKERRDAVRRFQEDDVSMLFVGNPAAAGAGLTLHRSRYAVYESMSNQAAHYLQSLDRIHRRGQERPVEYAILLCDQSIEIGEYDRLLKKEQSAQSLLGDHTDPPFSRETLLREAVEAADLLGLSTQASDAIEPSKLESGQFDL